MEGGVTAEVTVFYVLMGTMMINKAGLSKRRQKLDVLY